MYNPETGGQIDVRNNENMVWNSINLKRVRPVVLPGIRLCRDVCADTLDSGSR